jgi:hypothetical protein
LSGSDNALKTPAFAGVFFGHAMVFRRGMQIAIPATKG